jgi:drug/metabolite transporter (DMT)-like permease
MAPSAEHYKKTFADIGLFYAAAVWGATFFMVKGALDDIDPVVLVAYRFLIAGALLLPFLWLTGRNLLKGLKRAAFLAVILWSLYVSQTIGLEYTKASNSGFITGLFVAFIPLFLRTIFKRRPTLMELIASVVSLFGLWVLTGRLTEFNLGDGLTLIAAMTYALHVLYSDKYMKAGIDPYTISCQQFLIIGGLSILTALVLDLPFTIGSSSAAWTVVFLALVPTLSAFVIQMVAQRHVSPLRVSLIFALEPVFAGAFAWTLGGEEMVLHGAVGGGLVFLALLISGLPTPGVLSGLTQRNRP